MQADVSSTGIARVVPGSRSTSDKDLLFGVGVPVVPDTAVRARPVPDGQRRLGEQVSTCGAGLAGRAPTGEHDNVLTRAFDLVLELIPELIRHGVHDVPGESGLGANVPARPGHAVLLIEGRIPDGAYTADRAAQLGRTFRVRISPAHVLLRAPDGVHQLDSRVRTGLCT